MIEKASWITAPCPMGDVSPCFQREIPIEKEIQNAEISVSAAGMYKLFLNGEKIGDDIFAPYWTSYRHRIQYQTYDITNQLKENNTLKILCGQGWAVGYIAFDQNHHFLDDKISVIFSVDITYTDGTSETILSDDQTKVWSSNILYSQVYHGETIDGTVVPELLGNAQYTQVSTSLVPQQGEIVCEQERIAPVRSFRTPKDELVIDFGQNLAGYVEICAHGKKGEKIVVRHGEVLDRDGNFYTENLRTAKCTNTYILSGNDEIFKPSFSFQGFRYICLDSYPDYPVDLNDFQAVAVYSKIRRTSDFSCGHAKINQLYHNILWGQRSNFVDVPTDCPQRDERLGWTGDAQVFCRTAAINFDVKKFFEKWLQDLALEQGSNGAVPHWIPVAMPGLCQTGAAGWGDAAVICPWELYLAYGDINILKNQFDSMQKWVEYVRSAGGGEYLWIAEQPYGDWLGLDAEEGAYVGATDPNFIASCYYYYSTDLLVKAGEILGHDMTEYKARLPKIREAILNEFTENGIPKIKTQTACVLLLYFDISKDKAETAKLLADMVLANDKRLTTGFLGTPYLLHALSDNGYLSLAYDLLLQEKFPSWLYSVNRGATTIWEHWDGMNEKGEMWNIHMNSFNHYAYGAVCDWIFGTAAGIRTCADAPGYQKIRIEPNPDARLGFVNAKIKTAYGDVCSNWYYKDLCVVYEISVPENTTASILLPNGHTHNVEAGTYTFYTAV